MSERGFKATLRKSIFYFLLFFIFIVLVSASFLPEMESKMNKEREK